MLSDAQKEELNQIFTEISEMIRFVDGRNFTDIQLPMLLLELREIKQELKDLKKINEDLRMFLKWSPVLDDKNNQGKLENALIVESQSKEPIKK